MIQVDMSEYMEKHSVSRLVGSPPVMSVTTRVAADRIGAAQAVFVLLMTRSRGSPDVFNILLQILEDGKLTDSQGARSTSATQS